MTAYVQDLPEGDADQWSDSDDEAEPTWQPEWIIGTTRPFSHLKKQTWQLSVVLTAAMLLCTLLLNKLLPRVVSVLLCAAGLSDSRHLGV
jgi:hypothetical protein